jgi:hypothetical protein
MVAAVLLPGAAAQADNIRDAQCTRIWSAMCYQALTSLVRVGTVSTMTTDTVPVWRG